MPEQIRIQDEGVDLGLVTTLNFIGANVSANSAVVGGRRVAAVDVSGAGGGPLVIENRTDDPVAPATGRIWLRTDL